MSVAQVVHRIWWVDWTRSSAHKASKYCTHRPRFSSLQELQQANLPHKITPESIFYNLQTLTNTRCFNLTSKTTSALLILTFRLIMCRITTRWPRRSPKLWPGYLHLNPKDGTRTFGPVGSTRWETGSCRLKNIGIGSVVPMVNLMV